MNEIAKNYYETVNERSITAKSSHAKNGGNSEKLGNKQLTRKEIEEKHGPVKTYTFDDFLSFSEFREMPTDWQATYINNLQDKYDIGLTQIGRDLFGQRDDNVLRSHLKLKGILDKVNPDKRRGRTKLHEFRRDIRGYRNNPAPKETPEKPQISFIDYQTFKHLKPSEQAAFINRVISEYGIGVKNIGEDLFGLKNGNVLGNYLKRKLPDGMLVLKRHNGNTRSAEYKAKFERFRRDIAEWKKGKVCSEVANAVGLPEDILKNAPEPKELKAQIDEISQKFNDRLEKGEIITVDDVKKELRSEPVPDEKNEVVAKPPVFKTKQKVFSTCYIGNDFNMTEIDALRKMFAGQKIQVEITVTTDSLMEKYE